MPQRLNILFTQAQTYYASDARIHGTLMRRLDRERFGLHAAVNVGCGREVTPGMRALSAIPDLNIYRMRFTPSANGRPRAAVLRDTVRGVGPSVGGLSGLVGYVRRNQIHAVHCLDKARDTAYGLIAARLTGARLVIHMHVKIEDWVSPVVRATMRQADALIAISQFVRRGALEAGYADERIHVVLNGLDMDEWEAPTGAETVRQEFGIAPDAPLLAAVGRLFRWKGHGELLRALAEALPQIPGARLLVIGEDDMLAAHGASYRAELEELTRSLGLAEHVIFTGQRADVPRLLAAADVFALPSFEEPFGMVFLEAMALRKPVVALDNGGTREVVEHGRTGLLSAPGDQGGLAANLALLAREPALRARMGEAGRRRLEERFTAGRMATDMGRVYERLLRRTPKDTRYGDSHIPQTGQR